MRMPPRYFTNYPDAGSRPIEKNSSAKYCFVLSGDGWSISPGDNYAPVADEARMPIKRAKAAGKSLAAHGLGHRNNMAANLTGQTVKSAVSTVALRGGDARKHAAWRRRRLMAINS
jgi:hypothetical protein